MTYPKDFWQPALKRSEFWRTVLGLFLIGVIVFLVTAGLLIAANKIFGLRPSTLFSNTNPLGIAAMFATFIGFHIAILITLPMLHKRGYRTLFGPSCRLNLRHFGLAMLATMAITGASMIALGVEYLGMPEHWFPTFTVKAFAPWVIWVAPMMVLIFIQSFAEEVLFRGYLLQQLRARFRAPIIWLVLPSLAFGALHFDAATYGTNAWYYVLNTTLTGIVLSLITLRTGNLGAAAGLHFLNNFSMVFLGMQGSLEGVSLFVMQTDPKGGYTTYSLLVQTLLMLVAFIVWWRWIDRRKAGF